MNGGLQSFDEQERYLEILASLRAHNTEDDMQQDGMFLTHVVLLVYEVSFPCSVSLKEHLLTV